MDDVMVSGSSVVIGIGEFFCFSCETKINEAVSRREGNNFFCPSCGTWLGCVTSSFGAIDLTLFRKLHTRLPPGFHLRLYDGDTENLEDLPKKGSVILIYGDKQIIGGYPITVEPDVLITAAEAYSDQSCADG